jgi:tRNA threonylcarbamoyladenosine biosynthesis protein TsaB
MTILALELSSARGSLCATKDGLDIFREWRNDRKHSGLFFENLQSVIGEVGAPEKIIVGLGPGSYAGTRIAISAAIGLQVSGGTGSVPSAGGKLAGRHGGRPSTSSRIQLLGFPSICAMNHAANEYCVIGDARRQSFFFAHIRTNELIEGPTLLGEAEVSEKLDSLEPTMSILCSEPLPQFKRAVLCYPSAKVIAQLAQDANRSFSLPPLEPMYLREPHITVPRAS